MMPPTSLLSQTFARDADVADGVDAMTIDPARRVQSLYVPVSDGVRLAIDVWLPVERIARGERVGAVFRATRYHRAEQPPGPEPEADSNRAAGELWTRAGFALVVADARGTGASFGSRAMELGPREIADYGELIDWVAAQPWSNGRVGVYGTSYEGQAAELVASLGNPHVVAVAALFSPVDPYRELFYPGGCATGGRFARWMCESQIQDGVAGAVERLAELTGLPARNSRCRRRSSRWTGRTVLPCSRQRSASTRPMSTCISFWAWRRSATTASPASTGRPPRRPRRGRRSRPRACPCWSAPGGWMRHSPRAR